jgi:hypothetical protein
MTTQTQLQYDEMGLGQRAFAPLGRSSRLSYS